MKVFAESLACFLLLLVSALNEPAWAGMIDPAPVPAPVAGAVGPWGLLAACVVYAGYRLVRYLRRR